MAAGSSRRSLDFNEIRGFRAEIERDKPLSRLSTLGVGGRAECYLEPDCRSDFQTAFELSRGYGFPLYIIGGGSNIVAADGAVPGVVRHHAADEGLEEGVLDIGELVARHRFGGLVEVGHESEMYAMNGKALGGGRDDSTKRNIRVSTGKRAFALPTSPLAPMREVHLLCILCGKKAKLMGDLTFLFALQPTPRSLPSVSAASTPVAAAPSPRPPAPPSSPASRPEKLLGMR